MSSEPQLPSSTITALLCKIRHTYFHYWRFAVAERIPCADALNMPKPDTIGTKLLGVATRLIRKTSQLTLGDKKSPPELRDQTSDIYPQHPHLNHLLQSNLTPQEHEIKTILECLERDAAQKNKLVTSLRMKGDSKRKSGLERRIHSLDLAIQSWKSLLSPIRRLPAEILLEIFGYLLVPVYKTSDLPWRLSHICRYWRDVVLCTPTLWARFPTIAPVTSEAAESQQVDLVETLTERAPHFLELRILGSTVDQLSRSVLSMLARLSPKWKKLTISATLHTMERISAAKDHLDSLEDLSIDFLYVDSEEGGPTHNITVTMFQNAPVLRRVTLTGEFHGRIALPTCLILFHDDSWGINSQERLLTIGRFERLQNLCIVDAEIHPLGSEDSEGSDRVHLPHLTNLSLRCCIDVETGLLRFGVFPKLRSISIDARNDGSGDVCRMLAALLSRSKCSTVEALNLDLHTSARSSRLSRVLQITPHLKELRCSLPSDPDIQQMALPNPGDDILVPNLTACTFILAESLQGQATVIDAIQSFIALRCNLVMPAGEFGGARSSHIVFKIREYDNLTGYPTCRLALAQTQFETWYTDSRRTALFFFQQLLEEHLPNMRYMHPHGVPVGRMMMSKASKILTRIEGYEPRNVNEVLVWGAHVTLARLQHLACDDSVKENVFKPFRDQALRIQEKWDALLADTSDKHWIWTCPALNEIQYIPDDSPFREDISRFKTSIMAMPSHNI